MEKNENTMWTEEALVEEQIRREVEMIDRGMSRHVKESNEGEYQVWNSRVVSEIVQNMKLAYESIEGYYGRVVDGEIIHRFGKNIIELELLRACDPETIAYIASKSILESAYRKRTVLKASLALSNLLEDQIRFQNVKKNAPYLIDAFQHEFKKRHFKDYNYKRESLIKAEKKMLNGNDNFAPIGKPVRAWTKPEKIKVGTFLIEMLREHVLFNGNPVIRIMKNRNFEKGKTILINTLELTEEAEVWIEGFKEFLLDCQAALTPCILPPRDWTSTTDGGYYTDLSKKVPMIKDSLRQHSQLKRLTPDQMPEVYKAVNKLQHTAWSANLEVLEVLEGSLRSGVGLGIPSSNPIDIPPAPIPEQFKDARGKELFKLLKGDDRAKFLKWKNEAANLYTEEKKRVADLKKIILDIKLLKELSNYPAFYYVHTLDYRGRIYSVGEGVNPQGSDLHRGLLQFKDGKELGEDGEYWLAVHGANMYGLNGLAKESFNHRYKKIVELTEDILLIASDPVEYSAWTQVKEPWQFLAFCFEWKRLQEHLSSGGSSESFVSHLPIHMDATCSGMQHYSMMLRDEKVGRKVNLVQSGYIDFDSSGLTGVDKFLKNPNYSLKPTDVYQSVADMAREQLEAWAEMEAPISSGSQEGLKSSISERSEGTGYKRINSGPDCSQIEQERLESIDHGLNSDTDSRSGRDKPESGAGINQGSTNGTDLPGNSVFSSIQSDSGGQSINAFRSDKAQGIKDSELSEFNPMKAVSELDRIKRDAREKLRSAGVTIESLLATENTMSLPLHMKPEKYNKLFADRYGEYQKKEVKKLSDHEKKYREDVLRRQEESKGKIPRLTKKLKSKIAQAWLSISGGINRSLTKQTVMTSVYGSTQLRCREDLKQYLKKLDDSPFTMTRTDDLNIWSSVDVCSNAVWSSMVTCIDSTMKAMTFLKEVVSCLPKTTDTIEWETPTGFIVEHKDSELKGRIVDTHLLGRCRVSCVEDTDKTDIKKVTRSIAPNFIQSMDAAHCAKAVGRCSDSCIESICTVHDSFGCHAGSVSSMRSCLTESFTDMYQNSDPLESFKQAMIPIAYLEAATVYLNRNPSKSMKDLPASSKETIAIQNVKMPEKGELTVEEVRKSIYMFS